jgi:hypothetical protein
LLGAAVIFYDPWPRHVERLLASLCGKVDLVCLLDGPFAGLAEREMSQTDVYETIDLWRFVPRVVPAAKSYYSEAAKRQKAANILEEHGCDRVLVIDCDEALIDPIPTGNLLYAQLLQDGNPVARMMRVYPAGSRWGPGHSLVKHENRTIWSIEGDTNPSSPCDFRILHTPGNKRIQTEQDAYNATIRPTLEN